MQRITFLLLLLFTQICIVTAQVPSDRAKLSLLTVAAGDMAQDTWGHSAIRLFDPINQIDIVYNYGTYDFDKSNFVLNFLKGKLDYDLARGSFQNFLKVYDYYERSVWSEDLDLTPEDVKEIYHFLENNARPENKTYQYLFFHDNCSTRIRNAFSDHLDGYTYTSTEQDKITFRQLLDVDLKHKHWTDFGIDLILGATCDVEADFNQAMFLPNNLSDYLARAEYTSNNQKTKLLKQKTLMLDHQERGEERNKSFFLTPLFLFTVLAILELLLFLFKEKLNPKWVKAYDFSWMLVLAISSIIMMLMWFATDHETCEQNWNLLWANPLYIPMVISIWRKESTIRSKLLWIILGCTVIALLGWWIIPQQFHIVFIPIMITSLVKLFRLIKTNA